MRTTIHRLRNPVPGRSAVSWNARFRADYPHWDFDSPAEALPAAMPAQMRRKIIGENAARLYARRLAR